MSSFSSFESWITGVCSPYVVSLCDFAYYVFGFLHPVIPIHLALWYVVLVLHREQDPQDMEAIKDYRHTKAREGLCDSEEL